MAWSPRRLLRQARIDDRGHTDGERARALLADWRRRSETKQRDRRRQLNVYLVVAVQAGIAAGLAWAVARHLAISSNPVFAPTAAVGTIAAAVGQRLRRTVELIGGVTLGIGIGSGLIALIGRGPLQTGLVVAATIIVAIALTGRGGLITQAGGAAVLVSVVVPQGAQIEVPQIVNAVTGGLIALLVVIALFPVNPLRLVDKAARPVMDTLSRQLREVGMALTGRNAARAQSALDRLRATGPLLDQFMDAVRGAAEVVRYSPQRRRWRNALQQYHESATYLDRVVRGSRGVARRARTAIEDHERLPPALAGAVGDLATAVQELYVSFSHEQEPDGARHRSVEAACRAGQAQRDGLDLSGTAVMAQVRSMCSDLLRATGIPRSDANRLIRQAANDDIQPG
ncbi:hypothetical protein GA0074695_4123 [Micromonospora viridifaciens]|uniref:Integral membrane bound transporter domain-containing protein n=2 Tax=Micromonospora viridifaciens TaxID=1881 RepID=A0A1C4YCW3_MICVI|nr:hypothetical protein GA0074695_4123 [Micromonospora viridifaciens]